MLKKAVQASFLIFGGTLGLFILPTFLAQTSVEILKNVYIGGLTGVVVGMVLFYALTFWAVDHVVDFIKYVEEKLVKAPVTDILFGGLGFVFGLIIAFLIAIPFRALSIEIVNDVLPFILTILFGYLGFQVGFKKRHEVISLLTASRGTKKKTTEEEMEENGATSKLKILDTSVIIDGRIADICQTGFLEGTIIIPQFVLGELQYIADSSDSLKRNRGRRGLDVLKRIQKELHVKVEIYEGDFEDIQEVDSKLVKLAKLTNGIVVTNDFNLNKVCEVQGVSVLNINDLSNAVKPVLLPGEEMRVFVVKDGKEHNQGVAYLDDGTMIVIEDGRGYIGKDIEILVTSVLQTSAGRMIFAKSKALEKAQ